MISSSAEKVQGKNSALKPKTKPGQWLTCTEYYQTIALTNRSRCYSGMALQITALLSNSRLPLCTGAVSRVCANFQGAGVKFGHILSPVSVQRLVKKPTSSLRGHITAALRAEKFSTTAPARLWRSSQRNGPFISQGRRATLGKAALGVALGVSAVVLVRSLHTGTLTAMAFKVNLNSAEGHWKEAKGEKIII